MDSILTSTRLLIVTREQIGCAIDLLGSCRPDALAAGSVLAGNPVSPAWSNSGNASTPRGNLPPDPRPVDDFT